MQAGNTLSMGNTALARNKKTLSLGEIRVSDKKRRIF